MSDHRTTSGNRSTPSRRPIRQGLTLLELMLVLAVLVVVVGAAWPSLARWQRNSRLRQAALIAHDGLASARLDAMRYGIPFEFRYQPGGRFCAALPAGDTANVGSGTASQPSPIWRSLPGDAHFQPLTELVTPGERLSPERARGLPPELAAVSWSRAIRFHPDGSATDAGFLVIEEGGGALELQVHRVTGGVGVRVP